jgi:hypothetical protein
MPSVPRASSSVIVAGIFAILAGALGAFSSLISLILFSFSHNFASSVALPDYLRPFLIFFWIFLLLCALFVVVVGVQVIRLRNWARISLLTIASLMLLFFGLMGIVVIFVTLFVSTPPDRSVSQAFLAAILAVIYGLPTAVSIWWLILFTRRSVAAQFQAAAVLEPPPSPSAMAVFNNPDCPLAIRITGWYLGSFAIVIPFILFLPNSIPAAYFGHVLFGPAAIVIYILNFTLISIPGIGLLLLKRWSYPLTIAGQILASANAICTALSPSYDANLRAMFEKMSIPSLPASTEQVLHYSRYFGLIGLLIPFAIVITLLVTRRKFYEAADRALQLSATPPSPTA